MLRRCDECKQVDCYILGCVGMSLVLPSCWFTTLVTKVEDFVYSSALCSQVVEIASLTEHRLGECESRSKFSQCPRCSEAVATEDLTRHAQGPTCNREFTLSHSFLPLANSCKMLYLMKIIQFVGFVWLEYIFFFRLLFLSILDDLRSDIKQMSQARFVDIAHILDSQDVYVTEFHMSITKWLETKPLNVSKITYLLNSTSIACIDRFTFWGKWAAFSVAICCNFVNLITDFHQ